MNHDDIVQKRAEVTTRMLEIQSQLLEISRKYYVDKVPTAIEVRVILQSEYAALNLEKNNLTLARDALKKAVMEAKQATFIHNLCQLLNERGMGDVVAEAKRMSGQQIETATA